MVVRTSTAEWHGRVQDGGGCVSLGSGAFEGPYSFGSRFEEEPGTNPEELIAAAHASCFSMALSAQLGSANLTPESINTTANLKMEKLEAGWAITTIHLDVRAKVPGSDEATFQKLAENAKSGCPVSKVLNAKISMNAVLEP